MQRNRGVQWTASVGIARQDLPANPGLAGAIGGQMCRRRKDLRSARQPAKPRAAQTPACGLQTWRRGQEPNPANGSCHLY